ncbi:hypothetical protein [Pseudomonas putida]
MDTFNTSALALQKTLLTLRQTCDRLRAQGEDEKADHLEQQIAKVVATLAGLPQEMKPLTLQ